MTDKQPSETPGEARCEDVPLLLGEIDRLRAELAQVRAQTWREAKTIAIQYAGAWCLPAERTAIQNASLWLAGECERHAAAAERGVDNKAKAVSE